MRIIRCFIFIIAMSLVLAGCWDRNEINDYAFWIGTALDLNDEGQLQKSAQIAIPADIQSSKGGGEKGKRGNIVLTTTGASIVDLTQQVQDKLPRRVFLGHRRSIFIGEKLARQGLTEIIDQFTRNADTRLRTDIFVVNNGEGKDLLEINSPFNQFSASRRLIRTVSAAWGIRLYGMFCWMWAVMAFARLCRWLKFRLEMSRRKIKFLT